MEVREGRITTISIVADALSASLRLLGCIAEAALSLWTET